jgi:hypothetical protein
LDILSSGGKERMVLHIRLLVFVLLVVGNLVDEGYAWLCGTCHRPTRGSFAISYGNSYDQRNTGINEPISQSTKKWEQRRSDFDTQIPNETDKSPFDQTSAAGVPSRFDTCLMFVSGIIGIEPKDIFFKNGHYIQSFPVSTNGYSLVLHFADCLTA